MMKVEKSALVGNETNVGINVIALLIAGTVYMWMEALFRFLLTNTAMGGWYFLYPQRTGDVVGMWLTISVIGIAVYLIMRYLVLKKAQPIRMFTIWMIILSISIIFAPFVGEIGTPLGI